MISVPELESGAVSEIVLFGAELGFLDHVFGDVNASDAAAVGLGEVAGVAACSTAHHQDLTVFPDFAEFGESIDGSYTPDIEEWDIHVAHEVIIA